MAQYPGLPARVQSLIDSEEVQQDYLSLRDNVSSLQIATLGAEQTPQVSYAPFVWQDNSAYLLLSDLAQHTQNLKLNPSISVMMIEDENQARNQFARRRIILQGAVQVIERNVLDFNRILAEFKVRFGEVIDLIEPLQDFHLFQVLIRGGRFIRGFGQAYALRGDNLDELIHIDPSSKAP